MLFFTTACNTVVFRNKGMGAHPELLKETPEVNWHNRDTGYSYHSPAAARTKGKSWHWQQIWFWQETKQTHHKIILIFM